MSRSIFEIRKEVKNRLIDSLRRDVCLLSKEVEFHLVGSFASDDWDGLSDVDVVCISDHDVFDSTHFPSVSRPKDVINFTQEALARNVAFNLAVSKGIRL